MLELCIQIGQLLGPIPGSSLLLLGVLTPFYFVFSISLISIPLVLLLPSGGSSSNRHKKRSTPGQLQTEQPDEAQSLLSVGDTDPLSAEISHKRGVKDTFDKSVIELKRSWQLFWDYRIIQYGYAAALVVTLGKQALHILLQYISKRFGVSIAKVCISLSFSTTWLIVITQGWFFVLGQGCCGHDTLSCYTPRITKSPAWISIARYCQNCKSKRFTSCDWCYHDRSGMEYWHFGSRYESPALCSILWLNS